MMPSLDVPTLEQLGTYVRNATDPSNAPVGLRSSGVFDGEKLTPEGGVWGAIVAEPVLDGEVLRLLPDEAARFRLWCGQPGYVLAGDGGRGAGRVGSGPMGLLFTELARLSMVVLNVGGASGWDRSELALNLRQLVAEGPQPRQFGSSQFRGLVVVRRMDRSEGLAVLATDGALWVSEDMTPTSTVFRRVGLLGAWADLTRAVTQMCESDNEREPGLLSGKPPNPPRG